MMPENTLSPSSSLSKQDCKSSDNETCDSGHGYEIKSLVQSFVIPKENGHSENEGIVLERDDDLLLYKESEELEKEGLECFRQQEDVLMRSMERSTYPDILSEKLGIHLTQINALRQRKEYQSNENWKKFILQLEILDVVHYKKAEEGMKEMYEHQCGLFTRTLKVFYKSLTVFNLRESMRCSNVAQANAYKFERFWKLFRSHMKMDNRKPCYEDEETMTESDENVFDEYYDLHGLLTESFQEFYQALLLFTTALMEIIQRRSNAAQPNGLTKMEIYKQKQLRENDLTLARHVRDGMAQIDEYCLHQKSRNFRKYVEEELARNEADFMRRWNQKLYS